jgi:hypothetical protein
VEHLALGDAEAGGDLLCGHAFEATLHVLPILEPLDALLGDG